jgi:protein-tyrosine phosphatase
MEIYQIDDKGLLYIGPDIDEWDDLNSHDIHVIFDLDDDLDIGIPEIPNQLLYIYFPFEDRELPNLAKLHENAKLGASLIKQGYRVLCHCGMGHNRSALLAGLILTYLGMSGGDAIELIRRHRQGALYNKNFAAYLQDQPGQDPIEMIPQNQVMSEFQDLH